MSKYKNSKTDEVKFEDSLKDYFNDEFDEIYPPIEFGTLTYNASRVFEEVDPIAYQLEFSYWLDANGWECL